MTQKNQQGKSKRAQTPDAVVQFVDNFGQAWDIAAEFKIINGRVDIAAIRVQSSDFQAPVSRRALRDVPLEELFGDAIAVDSAKLSRMLRQRQKPTSNQGRQHSDDDLRVIATIYHAAHNARIPVQQAVADAQGVSVSTAAKRIMAARSRGFITSTRKEK
jgi:hypothetical protein